MRARVVAILAALGAVGCEPAAKERRAAVRELVDVATGGGARYITLFDGVHYFNAADAEHGHELWRSDVTAAGTRMVTDLNKGPADSYPSELTVFGGRLVFAADGGSHGRELWSSSGQADGTALLADVQPGAGGSNPQGLTPCGPYLYFGASTEISGHELWRTDGTADGTLMLGDLTPGADSSSLWGFECGAAPGVLGFKLGRSGALDDDAGEEEVAEDWESDGTPEGTARVGGPRCESGAPSPDD